MKTGTRFCWQLSLLLVMGAVLVVLQLIAEYDQLVGWTTTGLLLGAVVLVGLVYRLLSYKRAVERDLGRICSQLRGSEAVGQMEMPPSSLESVRALEECLRLFLHRKNGGNLGSRYGVLAMVSHEIRTPMNGVLALADDLLTYDLRQELKAKVEMIRLSGESLVRILDDVLDYSKIEAGKLDVKMKSFDVLFACRATHSLFRAAAAEKGLDYEIQIEPDVPRFVVGDSVRVRQIMTNLLSNAVKFTESGSVRLLVQKESRLKDGLLLSVFDTGPGVSPINSDRLFQAYEQVDSDLGEKGTGLGLAISKHLASLMSGDLMHRENGMRGSVFELWIPYVEGESVEERDDWAQAVTLVENARILIVEDNRINQHVIESLLARANHQVEIASNGLEALSLIDERRFDIVFMDCLMPKLNGFEAARRIRSLPEGHQNRDVPIVALTANAFEHDRALCFEAGMNDFLAKPVKKSSLLGAVNYFCGSANRGSADEPE